MSDQGSVKAPTRANGENRHLPRWRLERWWRRHHHLWPHHTDDHQDQEGWKLLPRGLWFLRLRRAPVLVRQQQSRSAHREVVRHRQGL